MCDCNNYSLLTANTGVVTINTANNNLDGSGTLGTVLTAGESGTIVKSVIIKGIVPTTTGMVRLFIKQASPATAFLYKEVPIPTNPVLNNTPTPAPVLPMFEMTLKGDIKLEAGLSLVASTQNAESFVVIAEGLDWTYPETLPSTCCNYLQEVANTGRGIVNTANTNLNGDGEITSVFTADVNANGSTIKAITIKALQSTNINGMIRLFIKPTGGIFSLMREVQIPETTQSAFEPSFKMVLNEPFNLKAGYVLGVATQNAESFAITVEATDWSYPIS